MITSFVYAAYNFAMFLIWLVYRSTISQEINLMKHKIDHPFSSPESSWSLRQKIGFNTTFLNSAAAISFILHSVFGVLGPLVDPVFHTLHLLLLVNISKPCLFILRATFKHISQLASTFVLAVFLIYSFSVLTSEFYSDKFNDDFGTIDVCESLSGCFFYILNFGLRNGGGIAESMNSYKYGEDGKFILKLIYDLGFFIIIKVIILNIVFGVIIDTFGELRMEFVERCSTLNFPFI